MGDASWATHHIATDARSVKEIFVGDVDDDGDLDLVAVDRASLSNAEATDSATDTVTWYDMHLVPFPTASPTITFKPTDAPLPLPTPRPTALPTPVDPLRPTHARTLVPTCLPTQATL